MRFHSSRMLALAILGILLLAIPAIASEGARSQEQTRELEELCQEIGLRDVREIPEGIEPVVIDTPEELRAAVARFRLGPKAQVTTGPTALSGVSLTDQMNAEALATTLVSLHRRMKIHLYLPAYFNLWADVWVSGSGSFWEITDVHDWVGLSGITYIFDLSNEWSYHRISTDRQSVVVRGGATLDYYLLVKGVFKVFSEPISSYLTYRIR